MNAEARNSIDNLLATLKTELAQPGRSLIPLLTSMSRFPKYSLSNQLLIFAQRPTATCVMGYRAWNKAGFQVRKGEKGIAIYAPMRFRSQSADDALDDSTSAIRVGFRVAYVFDLAQVEPLRFTSVLDVFLLGIDFPLESLHRLKVELHELRQFSYMLFLVLDNLLFEILYLRT